MKPQSDELNDDWTRRYSEIRLGTEFDLVPAVAAAGMSAPSRNNRATAEHPLHPLPRHGPVRAAVRLSGADAQHPAAGRSRGAVPQGVLRRADLLRQPRLPADGPVLPQQRHARARPPRLVAERLRPAPRSPAARRRLLLGADRRAAHLPGSRGDRLRRRDRARHQRRRRRRPDRRSTTLRDCAEPFFLSVGFFETHRQFSAPTSVRDTLYSLPPPNLPDTPRTRQDMAAFKASARSLDQGIGAVLNGLHELGLAERTLIICTTDHGLAFPGRQGDAVRPRHRRDADDARAGRVHGRQGRSTRWSPTSTSTRRSASWRASSIRLGSRAPR